MEEANRSLTGLSEDTTERLKATLLSLHRVLTFSLADESLLPEGFISVSLEVGRVTFAYGRRSLSRIRIKAIKVYTIDDSRYPHPGEVASFLRLFLNETGLSGPVILVVPKRWVITRVVELPASVRENLSGAISYEMDRLTPFTAEDALYDFMVLREGSERISLMLTAVRAERIRPYIDALKEGGLLVDRLAIDLPAMGTLCRYAGEGTGGFILLRVDGDGYECGLFIDGLMHEACSNELTGSEEERVRRISGDLIPLVEKARLINPSPQIVLSGGAGLRQHLEASTGLRIRMMEDLALEHKEGYIAIGGLIESLWKDARPFNLFSRGHVEQQGPSYILTAILLFAFLISLILYMLAPLKVEGRWLEAINQQIAQRQEGVRKVELMKKEAERLSTEVSTIEEFKGSGPLTLDILKELTSIIPEDAWLTGLRIRDGAIEINGYATSATELLPVLDASPYFEKVEFASPTVRDRVLKADRFRIRMQIVKGDRQDAEE